MNRMTKKILIALSILFSAVWAGQSAFAATLNIDKTSYTVAVGQTVDGVVNFTGGGTTIGGYLSLYTVSPSIATVSPRTITIQRHPSGYGVVDNEPFTLSGIAGGSTFVYVKAFYSNGSPIGIEVYANVTVIECPVSISLEDSQDPGAVDLFRRFRDEVLAESFAGNNLIRLYDEHAWEASYLLVRHPDLLWRSRELLEQLIPAVQAGLEGRTPAFSRARLRAMAVFLEDVQALASPALQRTIEQLRNFLEKGGVSSLFRDNPVRR